MSQSNLPLESLICSAAIAGLDVSPDGRTLAFGSTVSGASQVYVMPIEGGEPRQITRGTESSTQPKWSPKGGYLAYLQDIGGDENYQVYVVSVETGEPRDITNFPKKLHENYAWSGDGSKIAYVSNRDGQFEVYYSDVETGEVHRVTHHRSVHHSPQFSRDGRFLAYCSNRSADRNNWDTFVVATDGGDERQITHHNGEADEMSYYANQLPYWSPDNRRVLVASDVRGFYDLTAIDVETLEQQWLVTSDEDKGNAQWSPDGTHVSYTVSRDGNIVIWIKELSSGRCWPVSQQEGVSGAIGMRGKGGDYRWTPDGKAIVYSHLGPREAGSIWIVSAEGGTPQCLYSTLPQVIDRSALVSPTVVHYRSDDGLEISGLLYQPAQPQRPGPAIVMPHGGPTAQTSNGWSPLIQYLVSRGYTVLAPNFRGSTGYGRDFQQLNRGDWGGGDLRDVVAAADWLNDQGIADRVGIVGGSYGGYMTMTAVTQYPDRWGAAVALFPMVDLQTSFSGARSDMKQFQERNIGTPDENPRIYEERSPINYVDNVRCPVLILQGERDARCKLSEVEAMCRRAEERGRSFELVVYDHEGHGFVLLENRLDSIRRTADFFDQHLAKVAVPA